ncbi:MAG: hypothetical protein H7Y08_07555 [Rhizobiaceae bacterium]|nr:hypothetical protein [Rhizobiaceae bacterium]
MSILNSAYTDKALMEGAMVYAAEKVTEMLPNLDEKSRRLIELTADGTTLGDALGITKAQKQALLDTGCRLIQVGELEKATDILLRLNQLDPLDERSLYALGTICQLRGELEKAAALYIQFLAQDATNPLGYLRLGECLMAAREYDDAYGALHAARVFAAEGKGQPGTLEEVERLMAVPEIAAVAEAA